MIGGPLKYKFGYQKCIYIAGLEIEISRKLYVMYVQDTVVILKNDIFLLLGHFLRVILSLIFYSYIKFHKIRLINLIYHTWSHNHIWVSRWRFAIRIVGTQITVILDLVNKSLINVAEMYFIGFVDTENIRLDTKSIFLAGLEIKIS